MSKVKAIVKLADGNVGFYDNLTQIHLTILSPLGKVYEGMNTTNLQRGVKFKTIEVLEGSLTSTPVEEKPVVSTPMEELTPAEKVEEEKVPEVVEPEPEKEEIATEEKAEESEEEVKETKTRKKRTSKKTTSSTEESK